MNKASAGETVDCGSIPDRIKPKIIKIGIHSFLLDVQQWKGDCVAGLEKLLGFALITNFYKCNYNLKFSITIIQVQVIVIQLHLQWKDSQNVAINSVT